MHDMRDSWRNQGYSALNYQQGHFEHAAQEHQRVGYEQVENAAALVWTCTAAQMTAKNDAEANFNHQQRGLLSEITSESGQTLESQRNSLIHEATAEMMRRDTRNQEAVFPFRK